MDREKKSEAPSDRVPCLWSVCVFRLQTLGQNLQDHCP